MNLSKYIATIPGNYIAHWMNEFAIAVEHKQYKRIDYKTWKELRELSNANKVKIAVEKDPTEANLKTITFFFPADTNRPFLSFTEQNEFFKFINNDLFKDKLLEIKWERCDMASKIDVDPNSVAVFDTDGNLIWKNLENAKIYTASATTTANPYSSDTLTATSVYNAPLTITYGQDCITNSYSNEINTINKKLEEIMKGLNKEPDTKKESNNMNTNDMFNFDFGVISDSKIRMSMYGYAIPNEAGKYVAYDVENNRIMDVQILNFNCAGMFYKIPKPLNKIVVGDVIFHNGVPMFIREISEDGSRFTVIDPKEGTEKNILPAHSPFGFDYLTCLVSLMDSFDTPADEENPFGNLLPLLLMNNGQTSDQTLPLLLMMNGKDKFDFSNPMMLMALSNNNMNINNPLVVMAMMKMFNK